MKTKLNGILTLLLALVVQVAFAQQTVTGKVTDPSGEPILGATVVVRGSSNATTTDFDGNYSLSNVNTGDVLVYSFSGYDPNTVAFTGQSTINISLKTSLDEIVVLGYRTIKSSDATAATASVQAKEIQSVPIASFDQILQGRIPGVEISSGTGQPGTAARIRLRGSSSVLGNQEPLIILDGIAIDGNSFASLNANDFESITALKDAEATSLYGARGAAGVLVIVSKKGALGAKTQFNYRAFTGFSENPELQTRVLNAREFLELNRTVGNNTFTDAEIDAQVAAVQGTNPFEDLTRIGITNSHEISASGGSDNSRFFTSISYFEQDGTVTNSDLQRMTARANLGFKVGKRLDIQINNSIGYSRRNFLPSDGGVNLANPFLIPFVGSPALRTRNDDGTFNTGNPTLLRVAPNVIEDLVFGIRDSEEVKIISTATFNFDIGSGFRANYNIGVDFEDDFNVTALNPNTFRGQTIPGITDADAGLFGQQTETSVRDFRFTSTASLSYNKTFNKIHDVNAAIFHEVNFREFRSSTFTGFGLEPALFGFANSITQGTVDNGIIPTVGGAIGRNALVSTFANAGYSYDNRYGITGSIRTDTSSRIDPEFADDFFWSVGGRWSIDNEAFMDDIDWISQLKIRGSYGTSGNDNSAGDNGFIQQLGRPIFLGRPQFITAGLANPTSRWEFTRQWNIGLDFGLLQNKLTGSVDVYNRETENLAVVQNLAAAFGDTAVQTNIGSIEGNGIEAQINYTIFNNKDWRLDVFGNGAYNFTTVTDLGPQITQFVNGTSIVRVGEQLGSHFVVPFAGVNPANGEALFVDIDGNITNAFSDNDERTGFGSSEPLYTGGFGFDLNYKGFGLNTLFTFQAEVTRFNNVTFFAENFNFLASGFNQSVTILDFFRNPGDLTQIPAPFVNGAATQRQFSSRDLEDASFLRLRDITLSYTFTDSILSKTTFLDGARIYARGVNLLTFTNFSGLDPEDDSNISQFAFPNATQYVFGIDLTF